MTMSPGCKDGFRFLRMNHCVHECYVPIFEDHQFALFQAILDLRNIAHRMRDSRSLMTVEHTNLQGFIHYHLIHRQQSLQLLLDEGAQLLGLGELLLQLLLQRREPLLERHVVLFRRRRADIAARRQDMVVRPDLLQRRRLAEARHVLIGARVRLAAPGVIGRRDLGDVLVGELLAGAVHHVPELAGVDEQHLAAPVAPAIAGVLVAGQEPEAGRNLRRVEKLARQGDHAVHHVGFDHRPADVALARLRRGHRTVGQHHARRAVRGKVVEDVLEPGVVGVADRRRAVFPAHVLAQPLAAPVGDVEGRIGEDEVGLAGPCSSSLWKLPSLFQRMSASMPRTARFILASRQVVWLLSCP